MTGNDKDGADFWADKNHEERMRDEERMEEQQQRWLPLHEVMEEVKEQLQWRGPSGKRMGHVVLPRELAEALVRELEKGA